MKFKDYPQDKRRQIAAFPREEIAKFVLDTPWPKVKPILLRLPPTPGFRPGKKKDLERRLRHYVRRIDRWTEWDWNMFREIWEAWVQSNDGLASVLERYDNEEDFNGGGNATIPNTRLDVECFRHLMQASHRGEVVREQVEAFYTYGYFLPDERIELYIAFTKSQSEVAFEKEVGLFKHRLDELSERTSVTEKSVAAIREQVDSIANVVSVTSEEVRRVRDFVNKLMLDLRGEIASVSSLFETVFDDRLGERDRGLRAELMNQVEPLLTQMKMLRNHVQQVNDVIANVREDAVLLASRCDKVESKLSALEKALEAPSPTSKRLEDQLGLPSLCPRLVEERIDWSGETSVLETPEMVLGTIRDNLRGIGMLASDAGRLASEVLAAQLAGQLVTFSGSVSYLVASVCAQALSGNSTRVLHIPAGLLDGAEFSSMLNHLSHSDPENSEIRVLIFEGINRSAPEVYAARLRSLISRRLFLVDSGSSGVLMMATLAEGSAVIPLTPEFCELGPVLDTDCLEWRDNWEKRSTIKGSIPIIRWLEWSGHAMDDSSDWRDLDLESTGIHISTLWLRCLTSAAKRLGHLSLEEEGIAVHQSLAFGWLLPRMMAQNPGSPPELSLITDVIGDNPDERIVRLLGGGNAGGD